MNTESREALTKAQHVLQDDFPDVDSVRLARVQARIRSDIESERPKWFVWAGFASAACLAAALLIFVQTSDSPTRHASDEGVAVWQSEPTDPQQWVRNMTNDGAPLLLGELRFDIDRLGKPQPFVITTEQAEMSIREATFVLAASSELTRISVEAGRVQVRASGNQAWRELTAGQTWKHGNSAAQKQQAVATHIAPGATADTHRVASKKGTANKHGDDDAVAAGRAAVTVPKTIDHRHQDGRSARADDTPPIARLDTPGPAATEPPVGVEAPVAPKTPAPSVTRASLMKWMRAADDARRQGRLAEAAASYQHVSESPDLAGLREEASLRWAETARRLGRQQEALDALRAHTGGSALLPERLALQSRLHLDLGQTEAAERLIVGRAPRPLALVVSEVAFDVAERLGPGSKAVTLCQLVRASRASTPSLKDRARALEAKSRNQKENDR